MVGILSIKSKTSKILAERLGFSLFSYNKSYKLDVSTIIRWGSTATGSWDKEINTQEAVMNASNKKRAREILIENELPVPKMGEDIFPCVGRPTKHTKGRRFFYCYDKYDVAQAKRKGATYFSQYYPKQKEYRIHIGGGKLLGIAIKEGGDAYARNWNYRKGFRFRYLRYEDWNMEAIRLAKKAIKALQLDFGAVDIGTNSLNENLPPLVIFEANTAPALCPFMIDKYVDYFKRVTEESQEVEQYPQQRILENLYQSLKPPSDDWWKW